MNLNIINEHLSKLEIIVYKNLKQREQNSREFSRGFF